MKRKEAEIILKKRHKLWSKTTDEIYEFCRDFKLDPYLVLAIYHLEGYLRPVWFRTVEYFLYFIGALKNPSIGPFQVRVGHFENDKRKIAHINQQSLLYISKVIKNCGLDKTQTKKKFIKFGHLYNLDGIYGQTLFKLYLLLKKNNWVLTTTAPKENFASNE